MSLSPETQKEISNIFESVAQYFATTGVSQDYYKTSNQEPNDLQQLLDDKRNEKVEKRTTLTETFIDDLTQQIKYKKTEVEMLKDQLLLLDLKIDGYDTIIQNIDKDIIPLVDEINVAIGAVKTAYDNRISAGCYSDLYWEQTSSLTYYQYYSDGGGAPFTFKTYTCKKNPNVRTDYPYYGAKYYRKPQNQDYGANIVDEFLGTISIASTSSPSLVLLRLSNIKLVILL